MGGRVPSSSSVQGRSLSSNSFGKEGSDPALGHGGQPTAEPPLMPEMGRRVPPVA